MTLVNTQTGEIVAASREEQTAVARLTTAIAALSEAVDFMPIGEVVSLKAQVATIQTATKELGMSKEAQELAAEAVRRAEWSLRRAQKRAQESGEMRSRETNLANNPRSALTVTSTPREHFTSVPEYRDALAMGELDRDQFEEVLAEAKAEGNLSRANVAKRSREKSGAPAPAPAGTDERNHQEAELINAFASIVRRSLTKKNVATLSPRARRRLISILENAIETLEGTNR